MMYDHRHCHPWVIQVGRSDMAHTKTGPGLTVTKLLSMIFVLLLKKELIRTLYPIHEVFWLDDFGVKVLENVCLPVSPW